MRKTAFTSVVISGGLSVHYGTPAHVALRLTFAYLSAHYQLMRVAQNDRKPLNEVSFLLHICFLFHLCGIPVLQCEKLT